MIALDVSPVTAHRTGVGTYAEQLALSLFKLGLPLTLLTNRPNELPPCLAKLDIGSDPRHPARPTIAWLQLTANRVAESAGAKLAHFTTGRAPLLGSLPVVLTVHDLVALERPDLLANRERLLVAPFLTRSIVRASAIIAVSDDTAEAIARRWPALATPVHVIPEGVADLWFEQPTTAVGAAIAAKWGLRSKVWLHVGAQGRRKNLPRLCEAFALALPRIAGERPQLVLAGPRNEGDRSHNRLLTRLGLVEGRDIILTGYLPRTELHALVAHAEICVFPSLHEGFGLPLTEAMAAGKPCITSDRGALPQVSGGAAVLVDPLRTDEIAAALVRLSGDEGLRSRLSAAGRLQAAKLTWHRCATATAAVYDQALA